MKQTASFFIILSFLLTACSSNKLVVDRSQFLYDGAAVPTVQLEEYKSVQLRAGQDPELGVAMSISGGGSRSANFAMGVMLGLEKLELASTNALREVDYISTVSGGGFAGGAYIGALYEHDLRGESKTFALQSYFEECIEDCLSHSYTKRLLRANFNPKLWFSHADDGDALERAVDDHVLGYQLRAKRLKEEKREKVEKHHLTGLKSIVLGDLFVHKDSTEQKVKYPMMFANGSVFDKMVIFPFSPDILKSYKITGYKHRMKRIRGAEYDPYQVPLSVGIKASGSFPVLISNTTLSSNFNEKRGHLHVIDGAMTDNFGYYTALDVLKKDKLAKRKILFVIDADNGGMLPTFSKKHKSISSVKVYRRLASSGLDARRMTALAEIRNLKNLFGYEAVIFAFNVLLENNEAIPPEVILIKEESQRLIDLMKKDMDSLTPLDLQILYALVMNVGTKYTITKREQELLVLTGQKIVALQADKIKQILQ